MMTTATPLVAEVPRLMAGMRQQWHEMVTTRDMAEFDNAKRHFLAFLLELDITLQEAYEEHLRDHADPHNGERVYQFLRRYMD